MTAAAQEYTVTDLGAPPGGASTQPVAMNNKGQILPTGMEQSQAFMD